MTQENASARTSPATEHGSPTPDKTDKSSVSKDESSVNTGKKLTKKQRRKKEQRKQLMTLLAIVALVVVVVGGVLLYNKWSDGRVKTLPQDQRIVAVVDGQETEIPPYSACELDDQGCKGDKPFELHIGDAKEITLKMPKDVSDINWRMVEIFDDPGANVEQYYKPGESKEVTVSVESDKETEDGSVPQLTVLEIQSLLVGLDDNGEQTPVNTVWSIAPKK